MPGWSITRARLIVPLAPKAFGDDLAFAALDAAGMGGRGGAVRIHRAAFVGAFRQDWPANDRIARCHQHSVLRRDDAPDSLVAIQPRKRSGNDFVYAVVHHRWRICYSSGVRTAGANPSA